MVRERLRAVTTIQINPLFVWLQMWDKSQLPLSDTLKPTSTSLRFVMDIPDFASLIYFVEEAIMHFPLYCLVLVLCIVTVLAVTTPAKTATECPGTISGATSPHFCRRSKVSFMFQSFPISLPKGDQSSCRHGCEAGNHIHEGTGEVLRHPGSRRSKVLLQHRHVGERHFPIVGDGSR